MRKLLIVVYLFSAFSLHALDIFSDVLLNAGYFYSPESPLGFNVGLGGFDVSYNLPVPVGVEDVVAPNGEYLGTKSLYDSVFSQISLTYGFKLFDWLRVPLGISLYADSMGYDSNSKDYYVTEHLPYSTTRRVTYDYELGNGTPQFDNVGFNIGLELLLGYEPFDPLRLSLKAHTINFKYFFLGVGVAIVGEMRRAPEPLPKPAPQPKPKPHPTITPQELRKVELAYAETVQTIKNRGKNLYVNNRSERAAFIQRYQGSPNTAQVNAARNTKLPYYSMYEISQEEIVRQARNEPNEFLKVRMIHDWVADVFAYDYDLLWWMDNVSGRNAEFTLGQIINRQRGVCYEYAILFWFLLDSAGLDVYLICDSSEPGIGHAYNMVVINGTGYIIDTTWDSGNIYQNGRIIKFDRMTSKDYFMPSISQSYRLRRW